MSLKSVKQKVMKTVATLKNGGVHGAMTWYPPEGYRFMLQNVIQHKGYTSFDLFLKKHGTKRRNPKTD